MERIRIGNNIAISWAVFDADGNAHTIGEIAELYMTVGGYKIPVSDYSVSGNVISWDFLGDNQNKTGIYKLVVIENDAVAGRHSFDVRDAFKLVAQSVVIPGGDIIDHATSVSVRSQLTYVDIAGVQSINVIESEVDGGANLVIVQISNGGTFTIPIKNGSKGDNGDKGDTGATGPKGEKGDTGERGPVGVDTVNAAIGTNDPSQAPSVDKTFAEGVLGLTFNNIKGAKGDKGDQGNTGSSVDYPYELVNNVTTDDATKGLSAAQGVVLDGKISQLGQEVNGIHYEITKASASGSNITPVSIPQGTTLKLHFDRGGDSYTAYYKFFNAGGTEFVNTGTDDDDVELTLSDTAVRFYTYVVDGHTSPLIVTIEDDGGLQGKIEELSGDVEQIVSQKILDIPVKSSIEYAVTAGHDLNTTSAVNRFYVDMPAGYIIRVKVNYPQGNNVNTIYFYDSEGNYTSKQYNKNNEYVEYKFDVDYVSFAFYITADDAIADGTAQATVQLIGRVTDIERRVDKEQEMNGKLRLADVLYHWMKGEKFPIGFQGDSTTDGVSTTGWTTENSHPAQDTEAGGRGKADYVCELAYPKQLQNLLRAELGGNALRVYNIGYYGASLANNWDQLDAIYSDVYADTKMVGIVLGINDRVSYNTPADFYAGVKDWLVKYVEYFFNKGIVPFMVTNQVVTQCGFRPLDGGGEYSQMNEDYVQTLCNKAKEEVARYYGLEVIDMNNFGRLVLESSSYAYANITEGLHFKDLGHKLEAGFLFSQLIPWVNKTDDAKEIYFGFNCAKSRTNFQVGRYATDVNDKFKFQLNTTQESATDTLLFDAYMFNNSKNGAYTVKYLTPVASGYIVVDGDTANPIQITATEMNIGTWDIGLHHIQVYTGASTTVAFKGFLLESVN